MIVRIFHDLELIVRIFHGLELIVPDPHPHPFYCYLNPFSTRQPYFIILYDRADSGQPRDISLETKPVSSCRSSWAFINSVSRLYRAYKPACITYLLAEKNGTNGAESIQFVLFPQRFRHAQHCIKGAACYLICFPAFRFHASVGCTLPPLSYAAARGTVRLQVPWTHREISRHQRNNRVSMIMMMQHLPHLRQWQMEEERHFRKSMGTPSLGAEDLAVQTGFNGK